MYGEDLSFQLTNLFPIGDLWNALGMLIKHSLLSLSSNIQTPI
jgi:hypothetical protein